MWVTFCLQAQQIYGTTVVEQAFIHLAYFYVEQQLFNGNVDLRAGRLAVRNDFGTLPGACYDFMSLSICANPSSTANLSWTVFPVANWGGLAEFKIYGPLSFKVGGYEVNPNDGGEYGFSWDSPALPVCSFPRNSIGMCSLVRISFAGSTRLAAPTTPRRSQSGIWPPTASHCR